MDTYISSVTHLNDGSNMFKLPWKDDHAPLPSNLHVCEHRARSLARRLIQIPNLMKSYNEMIKERDSSRRLALNQHQISSLHSPIIL